MIIMKEKTKLNCVFSFRTNAEKNVCKDGE